MKQLILILLFFCSVQSFAQTADELLQLMDNVISAPNDKQALVEIIVTKNSGKEKAREATLKQKGVYKRLYRYTKPEKQAGITTLALPDDKMWLYMPAFSKPIKISLLSKSQAFTGTDFSYEDMSGKPYSERYTPRLLKQIDSDTYQLQLTPKEDHKSKYSKILLHLNKKHHYPVKMEYYNKSDVFFKEAIYTYAQQDGYWFAQEVLMQNLKNDHSTQIIMKEVKFDQGLSDDEFLVENMIIDLPPE